jgi:hypothetical protein
MLSAKITRNNPEASGFLVYNEDSAATSNIYNGQLLANDDGVIIMNNGSLNINNVTEEGLTIGNESGYAIINMGTTETNIYGADILGECGNLSDKGMTIENSTLSVNDNLSDSIIIICV